MSKKITSESRTDYQIKVFKPTIEENRNGNHSIIVFDECLDESVFVCLLSLAVSTFPIENKDGTAVSG